MAPIDFSARTQNLQHLSIHATLTAHTKHQPNAVALASPNRKPLLYSQLVKHIGEMARLLNSMGIDRKDRVALVLPNGPEFVSAFLAITSVATCAPLNPGFHGNEFDFYLSDLNANFLMTLSGENSTAIQVARARGIPILEISPLMDEEAGLFQLRGESRPVNGDSGVVQGEDQALLLHTSGSTSRPKIVPLTHAQICQNALQIAKSVQLKPLDRCLNIMPLFHIHGLLIATLSSLLSGASVFCAPKFDPDQFFSWFLSYSPTWLTGSPTIHHALLDLAEAHPELSKPGPLRLLRSSAAPLPTQLHQKLEDTFGIPFIEAYGMSECALVASNPLPPQKRKRGSVGLPADLEVTILDEKGKVDRNGTGEIVIRVGLRVIHGYENNPEANETAFKDGWFKTGDLGYIDADGYLYIQGRLKEIINRGGQTISPREVDKVILDHPAVAQAVTFPLPHPRLGEDLAAAVVLRKDATSTAQEIRQFVASRLIDYKVPSVVVLLNDIPKGTTGKVQRIGLAKKLGLVGLPQESEEEMLSVPEIPALMQERLGQLFALLLKRKTIGVNDNFFQLGGDSILATQLVSRLRREFQVPLALSNIFLAPTVEELSERIASEMKKAPGSLAENIIPISRNVQEDPVEHPVTRSHKHTKELQFSLFFFSADGSTGAQNKYRLVMESAKFADQHGFAAIWTPERHFHAFGGLYPNPSVLGAALAAVTQKMQIRAGSVVLPLQNPIRVAEEWSMVDNLSGGRVAIACASGWHANDFVFAPQDYPDRRRIMMEKLDIIRKLWDGQTIKLLNGAGKEIDIRIYPKPLQQSLPIWLTSHSDQTFIAAGERGFNVLTALWSTTEAEIARQIRLYRDARTRNGHDPEKGIVSLMLHTFIGETMSSVLETAKTAYGEYLFVNLGLQKDQVEAQNLEFNLTDEDRQLIVSNATERLLKTRGLIGTPATCLDKLNGLRSIGVDEIACLIDFGIDFDSVMMSLYHLNKLKRLCNEA